MDSYPFVSRIDRKLDSHEAQVKALKRSVGALTERLLSLEMTLSDAGLQIPDRKMPTTSGNRRPLQPYAPSRRAGAPMPST